MKTIQVIFIIIVISAAVAHARNYEQPANEENLDFGQPLSDDVTRPHHQHHSDTNRHTRHRKKRQYGGPWNNYVQDYNQPWRPTYDTCPEREILSQMMKIMTLMLQKQNAATPNVYVNCGKPISPANPSVDNRIPDFEDPRMNWGLYKDDKKTIDHDQFTKRPLNLEPYRPQNDGADDNNDFTTKSPPIISVPRNIAENRTPGRKPNICDFAYVSCCDKVNQRTRQDCLHNLGCANMADGKPCDSKSQLEAFNFIAETYKLYEVDD